MNVKSHEYATESKILLENEIKSSFLREQIEKLRNKEDDGGDDSGGGGYRKDMLGVLNRGNLLDRIHEGKVDAKDYADFLNREGYDLGDPSSIESATEEILKQAEKHETEARERVAEMLHARDDKKASDSAKKAASATTSTTWKVASETSKVFAVRDSMFRNVAAVTANIQEANAGVERAFQGGAKGYRVAGAVSTVFTAGNALGIARQGGEITGKAAGVKSIIDTPEKDSSAKQPTKGKSR